MNTNKWFRLNAGKWPRWLNRFTKNRGMNTDLANVSPEDLEKSLLKNLECPVCMEYMTPPINLCSNGHNICNNCRPNLETCPTCRHQILQARNYALEDLCLKLNYPCKFREDGCVELFSGEYIREHQAVCHYGTHACPLDKVAEAACAWSGEFKDLVTHLQSEHQDRIWTDTIFASPETHCSICVLLVHNEIFLYYKCFKDGKCYCVIQLFGTSAQASKYKYKVKLTAENKIEKISQVHLVRSITEDFEALFRAGNCVRLDEEVVNHYIVNGIMQLRVELSFTRKEELEETVHINVSRRSFRPIFSDSTYWPWCRG